ncbi:MAG: hypothetical protein FWH27_10435 [Planctomycetaceae bacterium]|nr:hypothetical protein [Planctomycetaceae bacterium]
MTSISQNDIVTPQTPQYGIRWHDRQTHRRRPVELLLGALLVLFVAWLVADVASARADEPMEDDGIALRSLYDGFPMQMPENLDEWQERREEVRRRILLSNGLWPLPERTPLNPFVERCVEQDELNVYRVTLESYPGFYVTGNLYVPKKDGREITVPAPGVMYAHGHWQDARFYRMPDNEMKQNLESGGESFESGRSPMQSFCVNMARNGAVVFIYDMVGHSDSVQIDHMPLARSTQTVTRPEGFGSVKAELHLQNTMGLHTWNSVRIVDWLETLPFVDAKRIAVTGASGGGTQSMILSAIDDRLAVSCPAVMVSTDMQGGCTCENAPYMRLHAGNIDFASLFAPKPLAMTTADDWTKNMPTQGFPDIKALYEMYGCPENVTLFHFPQFPHNYNQPARESVYSWINRHFEMGIETDEHGLVREQPFELLSNNDLTVWTPTHLKPEVTGLAFEKTLLAWQTRASNEQLAKLVPRDAETLAEFRRVVGGAMRTIVDYAGSKGENDVTLDFESATNETLTQKNDDAKQGLVQRIANALLQKPKFQSGRHLAVVVTCNGFGETEPIVTVDKLTIIPLSLIGQKPQQPMTKAPLFTKQGNDDVGLAYQYLYTFGYNDSVFVRRVHNIISAVEQTRETYGESCTVTLIALDGAGKWAALAASQLGTKVDSLVIDTAGFRFENVDAIDDPDFLPGGAKYFDLPGMIALCAPTPMLLLGEKEIPEVVAATYKAANAETVIKCLDNQPMTFDEKIARIAEKLP